MTAHTSTRRTTSTRPTYVSLLHAAEHLQVSTRTIRRMISRGEIVGYRLGPRVIRVDLNELDQVARVIPAARPSQPNHARKGA